jgi:hypothetical protein
LIDLTSPSEQQFNEGANFWHYDIGVPTIPGKFKTKIPAVYGRAIRKIHLPKRNIRAGLIKASTAAG